MLRFSMGPEMVSAALSLALWWWKACPVPFVRFAPLWLVVQVLRIQLWWIRPGDDEPFGW